MNNIMCSPGMGLIGTPKPTEYTQRARSVLGANLTAHWPLLDLSGSVISDLSGNEYHGINNGATLANGISAMGKPAPLFGTNADIIVYSPGLATAWPNVRAVGGFAKMYNSGTWIDGQTRYLFWWQAGSTNNRGFIRRSITDYQLISYYVANGVIKSVNLHHDFRDWFHWLMTWDPVTDTIVWYINASEIARATGLGAWGGTFGADSIRIGSMGTNYFSGWQSNIIAASKFVTPDEVTELASPVNRPPRIGVFGDSNSAAYGYAEPKWPDFLGNVSGRFLTIDNFARGGSTIQYDPVDHLDLMTQISASAGKKLSKALIQSGQNDSIYDNMATLQAIYELAIDTLRADNPAVEIYALLPFQRWESPGGAEVDKEPIRVAIRAACVKKNVPYIETREWFESIFTKDGTHRIDGDNTMHAQIANRLYPRIGL